MPSYLITGVSRGIGYEFLRQYSSDPNNTVIGLVRDKPATDKKVAEDPDLKGRSNIHILEADVAKYNDLQNAAAHTANITGGSLDYIIANAAFLTQFDAYDPIGKLGEQPEELTKTLSDLFEVNVIANVHLFNLFLPLILKGNAKKVIAISTGLADPDFTSKYDLTTGSLYSASKAALNMIVAKFSAQYKADGVLFLAISPGLVDVGHYDNATPEQLQGFGGLVAKFLEYAPHFKGPITPEQSVTAVRKVIAEASVEKGNGGAFLSHLGNKQWF
ncbi:NAD(P)-binding protein [Coniochaeta ligniaria NRRL 30616]|uniref:NAD(P)-binding protein n=1 Tax=Coniochaeta ligniaria NRRL 30616 TaxID=1408157 RepID=A0A1J7JC96_9PEZI|nr:NAD(P)-binding protein [Coniochaeta ligniaria NRRL 30616]